MKPPGSPQQIGEPGPQLADVAENQPGPSRQLSASRGKRQREKARIYRHTGNTFLEEKIEESRLRLEMYRKRWLRLKGKPKTKGTIETPRSKTRHLLRDTSSSYVKRALDFHHVLIEQMQQSSKQNTIKKSIKEILRGKILRKYKLLMHAHKQIKVPKKRRKDPRKGSISLRLKDKVQSFFERDDNSRTMTGKKQTKTRYKIKKQIRLLSDTIGNLYQKYKAENLEKISFITFWRLKPSWIRAPSEKERDTCLCKICENTISLVECLKRLKAIETTNLESLVNETVCSIDNKECMYGSCTTCTCKDYKIKMNVKDPNKQVTWAQWKTTKVSRDFKSGDKKEINIVGKDDEHGSVGRAVDIFNDLLCTTYRRHLFNLKNQYRHYRELRETLKDTCRLFRKLQCKNAERNSIDALWCFITTNISTYWILHNWTNKQNSVILQSI